MSSFDLLPHPEIAKLSFQDGSGPRAQRNPPNAPNRHILFAMAFCRRYNLRPDRDVTLSERGQVRLAKSIWKTYSESQQVHWKDCATDAAERHAEIFPGFRYQPRTNDENDQDQQEEDATKTRGILNKPYLRVLKRLPPLECTTSGNKCGVTSTSAPPLHYTPSLLLAQDDDASLIPDTVPEIVIDGLSFDNMWGYSDCGIESDSFTHALQTLMGM